MKRFISFALLVLLTVGVFGAPVSDRAQAQVDPTPHGCDLMNDPYLDGIFRSKNFDMIGRR